ncbi:MAG TPA: pyridoxal-phosphate dependent enzyme [Chloroflexota bacterium]|nr:pyridoxal-phosphate dependent enzyme [Chloroflexota bacterium]
MTYLRHLRCFRCGHTYPPGPHWGGCPACAAAGKPANLHCVYDYARVAQALDRTALASRPHTMWRYRELLPAAEQHVASLDEGFTPLLRAERLGRSYGLDHLYLKDESRNPTWSFKDRLAVVMAAKAREFGRQVLAVASSGNAGAATAAYAARGDLDAYLFTTEQFPPTMRAFMQAYGAKVFAVPTAPDRLTMVRRGVEEQGWVPIQNYTLPPVGAPAYALDGAKTVGFELAEQLGWRAPDVVVAPTSNGDLPVGVWRAFQELRELGWVVSIPRMVAAEVYGALQNALANDLDHTEPMPGGPTVAVSAANQVSAYQSLAMLRQTGGTAIGATDDEIMAEQLRLARTEGLWAEAASALTLAAIRKLAAQGAIRRDEVVVALITSTGLKDPDVTLRYVPPIPLIQPTFADLQRALAESYADPSTTGVQGRSPAGGLGVSPNIPLSPPRIGGPGGR